MCRCISSYHWSSWAFDARVQHIKIGGDGRVIEILKKRSCVFDLKGLSAVISLVQDHLKSSVQQACWGINDTNMKECEHICFCLPSTHYIIEWSCMCSVFILLNPPTGSESARTGQLWWGGFLYFVLFCWVTCLLEMWKDGAPASQQKTRLNATMLAVNSLYISTPPQKW